MEQSAAHPKCERHDDIVEQIQMSKALLEKLPALYDTVNTHMLGEGHPLLAQQLAYMRSDHDKHTAVLERLVETVTVACQSIKQLQSDRDELRSNVQKHDERLTAVAVAAAGETGMNSTNWKTLSAVGLLVLGNVAGLIVALLRLKLGGQ